MAPLLPVPALARRHRQAEAAAAAAEAVVVAVAAAIKRAAAAGITAATITAVKAFNPWQICISSLLTRPCSTNKMKSLRKSVDGHPLMGRERENQFGW